MSLNILVTGSEGYIAQRFISALSHTHHIIGIDVREKRLKQNAQYTYYQLDIRDDSVEEVMRRHKVTHVVHLASVMQASHCRERDYDIDVNGTQNIIQACIKNNVTHLTVTSSGAAYGYHDDNPAWLTEVSPLRGNDAFSYSYHKKLVEQVLAQYRKSHPSLKQLILRPGTVLGASTQNQITNLFKQKRLIAVKGSPSPFVFIWDEDVAQIIIQGVNQSKEGIYNVAGDGALTINHLAKTLNKPLLQLPAWALRLGLIIGHRLGLTQYSVDQLDFLRYRPVLDNTALKQDFGYIPNKTSQEVFEYYLSHNHTQVNR